MCSRRLRAAEDEIWDVGSITALFAISNRLVHLAGLRPDEESYVMGPMPRWRVSRSR
jgi:hypothetical protein